MERFFTKITPVVFYFLLNVFWVSAQPFDINFTLKYNASNDQYEVYARSAVTETFNVAGGSQITIVVPAGVPNTVLNVVDVAGGPWTDNSQAFAPAAVGHLPLP